jgi:hypothetical protein
LVKVEESALLADPHKILNRWKNYWSRGSPASIVSDYGLDDWAIDVRSSAGTKDFFSNLCVQTGSEAHPASCTMGTGVPFPGERRGWGETLTTHPHLAEVKNE